MQSLNIGPPCTMGFDRKKQGNILLEYRMSLKIHSRNKSWKYVLPGLKKWNGLDLGPGNVSSVWSILRRS